MRASVGFVSALDVTFRGPGGGRLRGAIEHTAPLARGSSGGPVVDVRGTLVGIDTHRVGDGFYLALPADDDLRARVDALARGEAPHRPRLGIAVAPPRVARRLRQSVGLPERDGLLVHAVEDGGPAERAGIRQGDLIVRVSAGTARSPVSTTWPARSKRSAPRRPRGGRRSSGAPTRSLWPSASEGRHRARRRSAFEMSSVADRLSDRFDTEDDPAPRRDERRRR